MIDVFTVILVYLAIGVYLFRKGVRQFGGRKAYYEFFIEKGHRYPDVSFAISALLFVNLWPYYIWNSRRSKR